MPLEVGSRLGAYEVLSFIGEGGMGRVFRARDTRLKREVAIKSLTLGATFDADRIARFRREAEALAALNHPHIATIHDQLEADGTLYLVLELVDGETLSNRLGTGPMPVGDAIRMARQIAEALEAAHARGIVHRDLKPANIKISSTGHLKVLDFGLAKMLGADSEGDGPPQATHTSPAMTRGGVILGTAPYMSPEQARGTSVDAQADIWAFGCVLYELLTGRLAFPGATVTDVLAAVVRGEPDWTALPTETPSSVRSLLRRCLHKEPSRRLHHVADARIELEDATSHPEQPVMATQRRRSTERWAWGVVALALAALAGVAFVLLAGRPSQAALPEMRVEVNTPISPDPVFFALSPDGQKLAFLAASGGTTRLWVRSLDGTPPRALEGTDLAVAPFWSPDGRSLGFFSDGRLKRIDLASGLVQSLATAPVGAGGTWSREGVIVYGASAIGGLSRVSAVGGAVQPATTATPPLVAHRHPNFLPDGQHFLFYAAGVTTAVRGIYVGSLDGGEPRRVVESDAAGVFSPSGHLLFVRESTLFAQRFDLKQLVLSGEPVAVADPIAVDRTVGVAGIAASEAGSIAYRTGGPRGQRQLIWLDRSGKAVGTVGNADAAGLYNPDLSYDGRMVAVNRTIGVGLDIWQIDVARGVPNRLTFDESSDQLPVWSPDGRFVVFSSNRTGVYDLYRRSTTGAGTDEVILASQENKFAMGFSHDSQYLLYRVTAPNVNWDLWVLPMTGQQKPIPVAHSAFQEMMGEFAPDGRWVAYQSNESGRYEIYLQSFPTPSVRVQISSSGGAQPRWRRDGKELFFVALDGRLMAASVSVNASGQVQPGVPVSLFVTQAAGGAVPGVQKQQYAVAPDGQRFLVNTISDDAAAAPITLVLNWKAPQ
jgi:Tol biopolymer transport system component